MNTNTGDIKARAAVDADYVGRQNRMLQAIIGYSQPGDKAYSEGMDRIYDLVSAGQALHVRMVEAYEDGLTDLAAKFARLAAEMGYALSDAHAELATAFESIEPFNSSDFEGVHMHDRHASNAERNETQRDSRDRFIDDCEHGNPGARPANPFPCARCTAAHANRKTRYLS